jgi:hypothetical protein
MTMLSLQKMDYGYDIEAPTFFYWLRAGAALALGVACVYVLLTIAWVLLLRAVPGLVLLRLYRLI